MAPSSLLLPRAPNVSTCSTPECLKVAQDVLHDIDFNIDPCSDFYQYTCGGWLKDQILPDNKNSNGTFEALGDIADQNMRAILEGTYEDVYKNLSGSDKGFHTDDVKIDKENFDTVQSFYNVCMNQSAIDSLGPTPIYSDIALIENELLPVNDSSVMFSNSSISPLTKAVAFLQHRGVLGGIVTMFGYIDDKNPKINTIKFDQPSQLSLRVKEYYSEPSVIEIARTGLNDLVYKVLGDYSNGTSENSGIRATESNRTGFKLWSQEKTQAAVNRFLDFETKIANATAATAELQNRETQYNPYSLSDFQAENPMVDWTEVVNTLIPEDGVKAGPDTKIVVRVPKYFTGLNDILTSNNVTLETLQEFTVINFVLSRVPYLDEASRASYKTYNSKLLGGSTGEVERWQECVKGVNNYFPNSIARYYVLKHFGGEDEKKKIESFITTIHDQWIHKLNYVDWLDNQTRSAAIEKVKLIVQKAAYGLSSPDLRDPASIKKFNEGLAVNETSLYNTSNIANIYSVEKLWKAVNKEVDKDEWLMPAQTVNAYYEANRNQIVVPAGILQYPFYTFNTPEYLNYGAIGMIIGHEIAHAFDQSGKAFDGIGLMTNWWTNTTNAAFEERSQCLIDQYSKFNVTVGDKSINVNGKLTLSENIADNGGLSASYLAYQTLQQANGTSQRIQGLEQFSPEALFFISAGRVWCSKRRDEYAQRLIIADNHSPTNARVNGIIQNSEDFATIFNCPVGSPMNPEKKCRIW